MYLEKISTTEKKDMTKSITTGRFILLKKSEAIRMHPKLKSHIAVTINTVFLVG